MIKHLTEELNWSARTLPPNIHKFQIDDSEMLNELIQMIEDRGDETAYSTNLKCDMTGYKSWMVDKRFRGLAEILTSILKMIPLNLSISDMWGAKYVSEEYAKEHDHGHSEWSFCLYLNDGIGFPPLIVNGIELKPEKGLLVMFPGWVRHSVPSKEFDGSRYVVAGNIIMTDDKDRLKLGRVLSSNMKRNY